MKNFYKIIGCLFLLCYSYTSIIAQPSSYNALSQELHSMQKQLVPDKRVAILKIELKDTLQPIVVLSGVTDLPEAKMQIVQLLNDKNIAFVDSLRLLPDAVLGDKTWALATLSVSNLRALPDDASELVSQATMGTPLKVLDFNGKWYRVQTPEHYIGWMDTSGLHRFTESEMEYWKKSTRYLYNQLSGFAYDSPSLKGNIETDLVLGDMFQVISTKRRFLKIQIPDGRSGYVRKFDCVSFDDWSQSEPNIQTALSMAKQMMGSPYLWGGESSKATDCSGFVKMVYFTQGIILARDASQQARYGQPIDFTNRSNLQPGDLLFFGDSVQHITHVGIYMGNGNLIHSSGRVHIGSIVPGDPKYNSSRKNVAACRILNSLNTEGIVCVKDHPWYSLRP